MTDRPSIAVYEDPLTPTVRVRMGNEQVRLDARRMAYDPDAFTRGMAEIYDAAKRDVRASMNPLERPGVHTVRIGNRVRLVRR